MDKISVIIPCYNEQDAIPIFYREIIAVAGGMSGQDFEFLFVDDGSSDRTLNILKELAGADARVRYISLSRNFGKESAMLAGLKNATGDYIALMDVDLQDPPQLLAEMYEICHSGGYDCAAAKRSDRRGESKIRSFFASMFYKIINKMSQTEIVDGARDFRLMSRQMTDAILSLCEYNRFSKGIFGWVGFRTKWLEYPNIQRSAGSTKWSFYKLFVYSMEGIVAFSTSPLLFASIAGTIFCIISFVMIVVLTVRQAVWGGSVSGWTSTICILLLISGIQLFCTGILGLYLSKTYLETKKRPSYIIKEIK